MEKYLTDEQIRVILCGESDGGEVDLGERELANAAADNAVKWRDQDLASRRPTIVCLCGSGRFRDAFEIAEYNETLAGNIVLTIGCNTKDVARSPELAHHKPALDELHLRKIDLADEVLILNVGGYIGESTSRELAYAKSQGKVIRFLEAQK